jgi:hypothetical protein
MRVNAPGADFSHAYCNWQTKLPKGWTCSGVVVERDYWWPKMPT